MQQLALMCNVQLLHSLSDPVTTCNLLPAESCFNRTTGNAQEKGTYAVLLHFYTIRLKP